MSDETNVFTSLNSVNVNEHVEKKNTGKTTLSYLSWCWALQEVLKRYPETTWEVKMFDGKPYIYDDKTGYMVFTSVTINGTTREMWLPVMDGRNDAMLDHPIEHKKTDQYGKTKTWTTEAATMFDINKTIMRCLTKNLAAFGLGLYIYAGEDLPSEVEETEVQNNNLSPAAYAEKEKEVNKIVDELNKYAFLIPSDQNKHIQQEIKNLNLNYLREVLNWCKNEESKLKEGATA